MWFFTKIGLIVRNGSPHEKTEEKAYWEGKERFQKSGRHSLKNQFFISRDFPDNE